MVGRQVHPGGADQAELRDKGIFQHADRRKALDLRQDPEAFRGACQQVGQQEGKQYAHHCHAVFQDHRQQHHDDRDQDARQKVDRRIEEQHFADRLCHLGKRVDKLPRAVQPMEAVEPEDRQ